MAKTWTIGRKLFTGVGVLAALVAIGGGVSWWQLRAIKGALDAAVQRDAMKLELVLVLDERITSIRGDERGVILGAIANDAAVTERARAEMQQHLKDVRDDLAKIEPLLVLPEGKAAFAAVKAALDRWEPIRAEIERHLSSGNVTEAWALSSTRSAPALLEVAAPVKKLVDLQRSLLRQSMESGEATFNQAIWSVLLVIAGSLLAAGFVMWSVRGIVATLRETASELGEGSHQVSVAAEQVSHAAQSLSQGATEQAASLEQTSASMEEMASMTRQNAENSGRAATLMKTVDARVQESNRALDEMVTSMAAIKESSDRISRIIKTIDEIAFQTNILALNAAVEAARAGEAGMGFAVVADEVRTLAQRSAQAARDTAGLIEESIAKSSEGATRVQLVTSSIRGITDAVVEVKGLVDEVSVASRQQAQGIDQVGQAVAQMEKVTQGTAATAEESAAASEELSAQAVTAMDVVRRLQALVGGGTGAAAAAQPAPQAASSHAPAPTGAAALTRRDKARVVKMPARPVNADPTPEEQIPLEENGTFGRF